MGEITLKTKWFVFGQNNSGGYFNITKDIGDLVFIEAVNLPSAIQKSEDIGIYFNGCSSGRDCDCCGDRWSLPWEGDAHDVPKFYGKEITDVMKEHWKKNIRLHGINGNVMQIDFDSDEKKWTIKVNGEVVETTDGAIKKLVSGE